MMPRTSALCALALLALCAEAGAKRNVLFIAVDDLRPELSPYEPNPIPGTVSPKMHTPHIWSLAQRGLVAKKNYVQQAVCGPSRASMLTSRRPDRTRVYDLQTYWREAGGNFSTMPQYFKDRGYVTVGMGKIFHPGQSSGGDDKEFSWTNKTYFHGDNAHYDSKDVAWRAVPKAETDRYPLQDTQVADHAVNTIAGMPTLLGGADQRFFLAVGFHKPHLPFVFPEEFLDYYPAEAVPLPSVQDPPQRMPRIAWSSYGELRGFRDQANASDGEPGSRLPVDDVLALRRGYYAAVSYTDSLVGRVLRALEASPYAGNTAVALWGDHGWQLGEHGEWCKHTNFEFAARAPLIFAVPGLTDGGVVTEAYTEAVDVFPTLVEAALGEPMPACPDGDASRGVLACTEGTSLVPLMKGNAPPPPHLTAAFSQYPHTQSYKTMGYSVVTTIDSHEYRFTRWCEWTKDLAVDWLHCAGVELYNHTADPGENVNIKDDAPEAVVGALRDLLKAYARGERL